MKITSPREYADASAGGFPEHALSGPDLVGINTSSAPSSGTPPAQQLPVKAHEFHDTRYRRIEYWFDATTQFREFLPSAVLTDFVDGENVPTEARIKVTGPSKVTWVPKLGPTAGAPGIVRGADLRMEAHGGRERHAVDLSGGRWPSGVSRPRLERLRIRGDAGGAAATRGLRGGPGHGPAGTPYRNCVTLSGNDPIWDSAFVPGLAPAL